jgi:hypothetical protein
VNGHRGRLRIGLVSQEGGARGYQVSCTCGEWAYDYLVNAADPIVKTTAVVDWNHHDMNP